MHLPGVAVGGLLPASRFRARLPLSRLNQSTHAVKIDVYQTMRPFKITPGTNTRPFTGTPGTSIRPFKRNSGAKAPSRSRRRWPASDKLLSRTASTFQTRQNGQLVVYY